MPSVGGDRGTSTAVVAAAAAVTLAVAYAIIRPKLANKRRSSMAGKAQNVVWKRSLADLPIDRAVPIVDGAYMLAESVIWSSREQELWWVDINGKKIMRLRENDDGASVGTLVAEGWDVPAMPGSIALREGGGREADCPLLVGFEDAFSLYNPWTGKRVPAASPGLADEYEQLPNSRLNDGRCDRQGRFVCGGINMENIGEPAAVWKPRAGVFRVDQGNGVRRILADEVYSCYNATCFSPDGGTMYATDTPLKTINRYDYSGEAGGGVSNKRVFVELEDVLPDGATVDSQGCVWVAIYGSGKVRRYSPEGELLKTVTVPGAKNTTCVAIGGPELSILFISSASIGLNDAQRMEQPNAGALFAVRLEGVDIGIPEPRYRG